jgi:hypothetical protein
MSIPESKIRINTNLDLSTLPLNDDVIGRITEYCTSYIDPAESKDKFWFSLGNETCRLLRATRILNADFISKKKYERFLLKGG